MRTHRFRPGRKGDAETIAAYHHRCWVASFADLLEPGVVARMAPHGKFERFRHWLDAASDFSTTVAELDGHAIGQTTVSGNEVVHLFIDPDHQGRGLGRALLDKAESMLREAGHRNAELHTIVGNESALALYRSAGWVVTDRLVHNDDDGVVYDEHVLIKSLRPPGC